MRQEQIIKEKKGDEIEDIVVVQKGANVYNYVGWSNNDDMNVDTGGAVQLARNKEEYDKAKNNMLRSVYRYGGFWIGRYEVGDKETTENNSARNASMGTTHTPVIQRNQIPYNYVTCRQAQDLSKKLSTGGKNGSLMFGIQWQLTCKFLETKGGLTQNELKGGDGVGSKKWGNYIYSNSLLLSGGKYNTNPSNGDIQWLDITANTKKVEQCY